jgi:hypothetical protein
MTTENTNHILRDLASATTAYARYYNDHKGGDIAYSLFAYSMQILSILVPAANSAPDDIKAMLEKWAGE